ncbi:unnamed protein product [Prunus armeniaca]
MMRMTSPTSYRDSSDEEEEVWRGTRATPSSSQPFQRKHKAPTAHASGIEPKFALAEERREKRTRVVSPSREEREPKTPAVLIAQARERDGSRAFQHW